ncbi:MULTISPECIES: hypothetical protein [unclassified Arthrobacter]|uniref:hypothetical protein n=1 Tax=unclassified Arthrobacter TaxID=235627 RepID=UPI0014924C04|nr:MULTISPECIES: hypothetical protein [unclassified Arthrobacter]NOJ63350.1 hypothetical protein [Arthrobacter sp. 147(2020)]
MALIEVYSKTTGEKQHVPEHFLASKNPKLNNFRKTPAAPVPAAAETPKKKES